MVASAESGGGVVDVYAGGGIVGTSAADGGGHRVRQIGGSASERENALVVALFLGFVGSATQPSRSLANLSLLFRVPWRFRGRAEGHPNRRPPVAA